MRKVHTDLASRRTTYAPWNQPAILPAEGARSAYTRSICSTSSNIESAGLFARSLVVHSRDGLSAGGRRIRTFRPSQDHCFSELVEPCAGRRSLDKSSLGRDRGRTAGFAPKAPFADRLRRELHSQTTS